MRFLLLMLLCLGASSMAFAYSPSCQTRGDGVFILDKSLDGVKKVDFDCGPTCDSRFKSLKNSPDLIQFNAVSGNKISFDVTYDANIDVDQYEHCLPVDRSKLIRFISERKGGVLTIYPSRERVETVSYTHLRAHETHH